MNNTSLNKIKNTLNIILITLVGCLGVIFSVLYVETFNIGFFYDYSKLIIAVLISLISSLTVFTIYFFRRKTDLVYKILYLTVILVSLTSFALYFLKTCGILEKVDSVEDFREYVSTFKNAVFIFILLQFSQVVFLPIPAFITVGAGVLLFGPFWGAVYSYIGIVIGSIVAFFIGRIFGVKVASWLVGRDNLEKGLKTIKGKDKIILTFMFLFPLFPDDILCFVAGITTIKPLFFIVMILITRLISIFVSTYSMNNSIIPYTTWWGIILWICFIAITVLLAIYIYKNGEKIEKFFKRKNKRHKN
jgi:uncharacterized membrane protein YdjX (TVP38/TMEM64 family)